MPSLLLMILSAIAAIPASIALIQRSRRALILADSILLTLLLVPHLYPLDLQLPAGSLDVVRFILVLAFHEFSSIYLEVKGLIPGDTRIARMEENSPSALVGAGAFVHRGLVVGALLMLAVVVSELYLLVARGSSASFTGIFGATGGVMVVIAFLFLLLRLTSRRSEAVSSVP